MNDLVFGTEYIISVAAINSVGRGPFSDPIVVEIGMSTSLVQSSSRAISSSSTAPSLSKKIEIFTIIQFFSFLHFMYAHVTALISLY